MIRLFGDSTAIWLRRDGFSVSPQFFCPIAVYPAYDVCGAVTSICAAWVPRRVCGLSPAVFLSLRAGAFYVTSVTMGRPCANPMRRPEKDGTCSGRGGDGETGGPAGTDRMHQCGNAPFLFCGHCIIRAVPVSYMPECTRSYQYESYPPAALKKTGQQACLHIDKQIWMTAVCILLYNKYENRFYSAFSIAIATLETGFPIFLFWGGREIENASKNHFGI